MAEKWSRRMGSGEMAVAALVAAALVVSFVEAEVYIVTVDGDPVVQYRGSIPGFEATAVSGQKFESKREAVKLYSQHLEKQHDMLLDEHLENGSYKKLYSYRNTLNAFAVQMSPEQAEKLRKTTGVKHVQKDWKVQRLTTHTPEFLGLPSGVWPSGGGEERAGEGVVIGIIDTGIYPQHPSFAVYNSPHYGPVPGYAGKCEVDPDTNRNFCNGKIVGAQHFAAAAIAAGSFNPAYDFASPLDGDGHGSHTAATAAGNYGVPVRMHGYEFGKASGMAPRARIAVYKALYRQFGGFIADVVAAIDQAVEDGVDILSLSVGPNTPNGQSATFLNPFDVALLSAVKAGVFVAQAGGNNGPYPKTMLSFSPWITSVAAGVDDRSYKNTLFLGNGKSLPGIGISPPTRKGQSYALVAGTDAMLNSSYVISSPSDCQNPEAFNKTMIEGNILVCGYSYNFAYGAASVRRLSETAKSLGASGFILAVENPSPGAKFDPVPVGIPGIVIKEVDQTQILVDYYNRSTIRDPSGQITRFGAKASIGNGLKPIYQGTAPQVAFYSSRGPDVKDSSFQDTDVLKPDILAPGSLIWAAWSPNGTDEVNYQGEGFAMISGTSMATPHIAGIAALVKQKHPDWSPTAIKSALQTTSAVVDHMGKPLQAQNQSGEDSPITLIAATPFDCGSGAVSPKAALDPGLIFDAGYEDYVNFLCSVPGIDRNVVASITSSTCAPKIGRPTDLNTPSITVSNLIGSMTILRRVTNVAQTEKYTISSSMPLDVSLTIKPSVLMLEEGQSKPFWVTLFSKSPTGTYSFGEIQLKGDRGHNVRIPVSVLAK